MSNKKIGIIDYEAGNLFAIYNACKKLDFLPQIINKDYYKDFKNFEIIIIPGVGSFHSAMTKIINNNFYHRIIEFKNSGKLLVGICLGMQLMCSSSTEGKSIEGFNFLETKVTSVRDDIKLLDHSITPIVPIAGWNSIYLRPNYNYLINVNNKKFNSLDFYFMHSYWLKNVKDDYIVSESNYLNVNYCSCFNRENLIGIQFHPERSGKLGLIFFQNLLNKNVN